MVLEQNLKWSPGGICVKVTRAGECDDGAFPTQVQEVTLQAGLAGRGVSTKSSKVAKEKKITASKEG